MDRKTMMRSALCKARCCTLDLTEHADITGSEDVWKTSYRTRVESHKRKQSHGRRHDESYQSWDYWCCTGCSFFVDLKSCRNQVDFLRKRMILLLRIYFLKQYQFHHTLSGSLNLLQKCHALVQWKSNFSFQLCSLQLFLSFFFSLAVIKCFCYLDLIPINIVQEKRLIISTLCVFVCFFFTC